MPATDVQSILQELTADTENKLQKVRQSTAGMTDQIANFEERFATATKITDKDKRTREIAILESDFAAVRARAQQEQQDFAVVVKSLGEIFESLGAEYVTLQEPNESDKAPLYAAQRVLTQAQIELEKSQAMWFNLFGRKDKAIARANEAIAISQQGVKTAEGEVKVLQRKRLLNATLNESLQTVLKMTDSAVRIMQDRVKVLEGELVKVTQAKGQALEIKKVSAQAMEKHSAKLNELEAELKGAEDALKEMTNGSPEFSTQEAKVSELRRQAEEVRGKHNTAFTLFQSAEKFAVELALHEETQMKLRDNQRMWIAALTSDTQFRIVTFQSRLEAMKGLSDQDIAKNLDDVGARIDQANAEFMVAATVASDRARLDKQKKHPERLEDMVDMLRVMAKHLQATIKTETEIYEQHRKHYGLEPNAGSFFKVDGSENGGNPGKPDSASNPLASVLEGLQ